MRHGKLAGLIATAWLMGCAATSWGATVLFSDFESPTYTSNQTIDGQDGWAVLTGTSDWSKVTPATDHNSLAVTTVLDGGQSLYSENNNVGRTWNGLFTSGYISDGLEISWLQQKSDLGLSTFNVTYDVAGVVTPVGLNFDASGNINLQAPDSGLVDSGFDYLIGKTYRFTMALDFSANTMTATAQNLTDSGTVINLGFVFYGNAFETNLIAAGESGGLIMWEKDGERVFYDMIQVTNAAVPEPGTMALVGLAGLGLLCRRRRSA